MALASKRVRKHPKLIRINGYAYIVQGIHIVAVDSRVALRMESLNV